MMAPLAAPDIARDREPPLSDNQYGRLALEALAAHRSARPVPYHIVRGTRVRGPLDAARLQTAFAALVERHEILRTGFSAASGADPHRAGVRQLIAERVPAAIETLDLTAPSTSGGPGLLELAIRRAATTPFDYARPPLLRLMLVRQATDDYLVLLVMHHLISDGWSVELVKSELFLEYARSSRQRCPPRTPLAVQYADFCRWQQHWLRSPDADASSRYWEGQWTAYGPALPRLAEFPFSVVASGQDRREPVRIKVTLSPALSEAVRRWARGAHVTLYTLLVAALHVVLACYLDRPTVAVMAHFANRRPDTTDVVGWFANAHVLGQRCAPDRTLADVLDATRRDLMAGHAHQAMPVGAVWRRMRSRTSLAAVTAALGELYVSVGASHGRPGTAAGLRIETVPVASPAAGKALKFSVVEAADAVAVQCLYPPAHFEADGLRMLLGDIVRLLSAFVYAPTITIAAAHDRLQGGAASHP